MNKLEESQDTTTGGNQTTQGVYRLGLDFRPVAEPGWRVQRGPWAIWPDGPLEAKDILEYPLAGWLIHEGTVNPAYWDGLRLYEVDPAMDDWGTYFLRGPGQPSLTPEEIETYARSLPEWRDPAAVMADTKGAQS